MASFDQFMEAVRDGAKQLAKELFDDFEKEAGEDARAFVEKMRNDLQRWTKMLAEGELTREEFTDLVEAKKALAEIHALRQKGIALARLERFRTGLVDVVVGAAVDVFL